MEYPTLTARVAPFSAHPTRWIWSIAAACVAAALLVVVQPRAAQAQDAPCPTPNRTISVDTNGDGTADNNVTFERCVTRNFNIGGTGKTVRVHFTVGGSGVANDRLTAVDTNGDGTNDFTAAQIAAEIAQWTQNAWTTYRGYGFNDPMGRNDMNVFVFDMRPGLAGWCCGSDHYEIDVPSVLPAFRFGGDRKDAETISYHEMWHAAEWSGSFGCWVNEGTASNMTDHVNIPIDNDAANDYMGRVGGYLGGGFESSLTNHCYDGALWWTYFMEQIGTTTDEPQRGVDAMRSFWRDAGPTDFTRVDNVIRAGSGGGRTFESLWIDFAVANYAKELTGGLLPRHRYVDEQQIGAPDYRAVRLTQNINLASGTPVGPTLTDIPPWSAQYYQFNVNSAVPFINLEVHQDAGRRVGYVLLLIRGGSIIQEIRQVGGNFVQSFANANYDRVTLIVVGLNELANYRYAVNNFAPTLRIVDPIQGRPAFAGNPSAPDKILVRVEVLAPGGAGTPIAGIDPNAFAITVGTKEVTPTQRISAAYVQGQYWLLVRAPNQSTAGDYNLKVDYTSFTDTESNAVRYQTRNDTDNVLVIDRSGSMDDFVPFPLDAAKDAGRLYVDSLRNGDLIGVVGFDDTAVVGLALQNWNDSTVRTNAFTAINGLTPGGGTSIGSGLNAGLNELTSRGSSSHDWAMIVLSDGQENTDPKIPAFLTTYNNRRNGGQKVPRVHTVALGPDADRARMEDLANKTGGNFYFASIPGAAAAATDAVYLSNTLAEIYRVASESVSRQQQIFAETSEISFDHPVVSHTITVDGAVAEAVFVLKWDSGDLVANVTLSQPDGTPIAAPSLEDDHHMVWRIPTPQPGDWTMVIDRTQFGACEFCAFELLVEASVVSDLTFDLYLGLPVEQRLVGNPMPIFASLSDNAPIVGSNVSVLITAPSGGPYLLPLHDDGAHGDGAADDGFYATTFYNTHAFGSYDVVATATGKGNPPNTQPFVRRLRTAFNMLETRILDDPKFPNVDPNRPIDPANPNDPNRPVVDVDDDKLPDWWEDNYGLDPEHDDNNQNDDPDHDGLTNEDEYNQHTDPTSSDTDGGGQNDQSETTFVPATDPNDPSDDQIPCPLSFDATNVVLTFDEEISAKAVVLHYDVAADHKYFFIWRSESPAGPLNVLESNAPPTGVYSDTTATLGVPYYYWLSAYDAEGHASCILGPVSATALEDAVAPEAFIMINGGAAKTSNVNVILNLNASADTTEMQVGHTPVFDEEDGWEPYTPTRAFMLQPQDGLGVVYAIFRDAAGNVSEPESDAIEVSAGIYVPLLIKNK